MPTPLTITNFPSPVWAFPRSYIRGFRIYGPYGPVIRIGNRFEATFTAGSYTNISVWEIYANFMDWNSNGYTLDHIIIDAYYTEPPSTFRNPLPSNCGFLTRQHDNFSWLNISYATVPWTGTHFDFPLELQPVDYWLPVNP